MRFRFLSTKTQIKNTKGEEIGMENNNVVMSRKQLYDEVWQQSAAGVAKKYNLHYGKLINSLKEANIPYPPSGYWTRINFGKDVSQEVVELQGDAEKKIGLFSADYVSMKDYKKSKSVEAKAKLAENPEEAENSVGERETIEFSDTVLSFLPAEEREAVIAVMQNLKIVKNARLHKVLVEYKQ